MTWFLGWFATMTLWKVVGIVGQVIFGSRFVVQWWASERVGRSVVPVAFWYLSVGGGALTLVYAVHIQDPVFVLPQAAGLVIYLRNLYFIRRERSAAVG